jgi:dihydroxyacetone kinase
MYQICSNYLVSPISATVTGAEVERVYVGTFMTSLEMAGVSITLIRLNEERKKYLGIVFFAAKSVYF